MRKDYTVIQHEARKKLGLTFIEYVIADEIYHLSNNTSGWCYKSKANIAERFGIAERSVFKAITKLTELGLLEKNDAKQLRTSAKWYESVISDDYAKSADTMHKMHSDYAKSADDTMHKMHTKVTIENNNKTISNDIAKKTTRYGNEEINTLLDEWEETVGYKLSAKLAKNRRSAYNLKRKHKEKMSGLIKLVALAQSDQYAPRISDFIELEQKFNNLLAWYKTKATEQQPKGVTRL